MGKKVYAVQNGRDGDGIYESWGACKAQVHGVKGVVYKGFPTREEAEAFLQAAAGSSQEDASLPPERPDRAGHPALPGQHHPPGLRVAV